jgi:hypothetical protein
MTDKTTREPCGNKDCDLCYPLPRWNATRVTILRQTHFGEVKAATVEEAQQLANGSAWRASYSQEIVERQSPSIEPLDPESLAWHAGNDAERCFHAVRERVASQAERFPRPVTCEWCKNRFRAIIPHDSGEKPTQGDDCAASVYQKDGEWYVAGHYGSGHFDMDRLRFIANHPTAPLDPVCDQCLTERIAVGDLIHDGDSVE